MGIVHRSSGLAHEGSCGIVAYLISIVDPLQVFETIYTFGIEHVGPFAVDACRDVVSVEVEHHVVFCSKSGYVVDESRHLLVVAVEEIDFETFDTHLGVVTVYLLEVAFERNISGP